MRDFVLINSSAKWLDGVIFCQLISLNKEESSKVNEELVLALNALGYKNSDINKVVKNVPSNLKIEDQIKEALKLLLK